MNLIQTIGLIIAVYAMVRVFQIPLEMTATKENFFGMSFKIRLLILTIVSVIGLLILGILAIAIFIVDA